MTIKPVEFSMDGNVYFYDDKRHPNNFEFGNYFPMGVEIDGHAYATAEHAYQARKFLWSKGLTGENAEIAQRVFNKILRADTADDARTIAENHKKFADKNWMEKCDGSSEEKNILEMRKIVKDKFTRHEGLRDKLLATKDADLIEDSPYDSFWGIKQVDGKPGKNWLGKILKEVRDELKKDPSKPADKTTTPPPPPAPKPKPAPTPVPTVEKPGFFAKLMSGASWLASGFWHVITTPYRWMFGAN